MSWRDRLNLDEEVKHPIAVSAVSADSPAASAIGISGTSGVDTFSEKTGAASAGTRAVWGDDERSAPEADPTWWRDQYADRAGMIRQFDGGDPRKKAELRAWRELETRWHMVNGERVSWGVCAGCRLPIGATEALDLIDGKRLHNRADNDCLIRHGDRWRRVATRALRAMGLQPPPGAS